jgi:hypothetical protein
VVTLAANQTIDMVLERAFWASVAHRFSPWDFVYALTHDGSVFSELLVRNVWRSNQAGRVIGGTDVFKQRRVEFEVPGSEAPSPFSYNATHRWHVTRTIGGAILMEPRERTNPT